MSTARLRTVGNIALGLSLLAFAIYFMNVFIGGPMGKKPWMGDLGEMLTLFIAVIFFAAGTLAREEERNPLNGNNNERD